MNFDSSVLQVAIEDIIPNRYQPREVFDDNSLKELAQSIKQYGIIQPLVLRKIGDKYEIVAGERRYRAAKQAGLISVPAVITTLEPEKVAEVAIAENVQRHELNAIEEARSFKALLDQGYMTEDQLASKMGMPLESLQTKLKLLNLNEAVQTAVMNNKISDRHAKALLVVNNHNAQLNWLNRIINERMTVKELNEELRKEYGSSNNINQIKKNALDIPIVSVESEPTNDPFSAFAPINLGEQNNQTSIFNSLEDEAVNMNLTETVNPFDQVFSLNTSASPQPAVSANSIEEIESLDMLDFNPVPVPKIKDITPAKNKVSTLIEDLRNENYQVVNSTDETNQKITYTITIQKEES